MLGLGPFVRVRVLEGIEGRDVVPDIQAQGEDLGDRQAAAGPEVEHEVRARGETAGGIVGAVALDARAPDHEDVEEVAGEDVVEDVPGEHEDRLVRGHVLEPADLREDVRRDVGELALHGEAVPPDPCVGSEGEGVLVALERGADRTVDVQRELVREVLRRKGSPDEHGPPELLTRQGCGGEGAAQECGAGPSTGHGEAKAWHRERSFGRDFGSVCGEAGPPATAGNALAVGGRAARYCSLGVRPPAPAALPVCGIPATSLPESIRCAFPPPPAARSQRS